jgi:DNA polymerase III epsilon subunit family exonuclease
MGYEYVDAESPDWPGDVDQQGVSADEAGADAELESLDTLRGRAVERARAELQRRRMALEPEAWQRPPVHETLFCVVDLETTGATAACADEIVEIGAVQVNGFDLGREFSTLVDPRRPISRAARAVHGIHDVDVWTAPRLEHALPWLLETVRDRVLVLHNAGFDLGFLQRALVETHRSPFEQPVLDTLHLARRLVGGRCSLTALAQRFRLAATQPHRALSDARVTALLCVELLTACVRAGASQLGEIPGVRPRVPRPRQRRRSSDALVDRLESAVRRGERLRISYHAAAGVEPLVLEVRPLRLLGALHLLARDAVRNEEHLLDLARIGRVQGLR